jgi:2-C-methyl-D-erythritol 4-phosphate cytidylyltransferase / 2-C-methyl-D-erythritol 2,4-cyclodiphosphate synthase
VVIPAAGRARRFGSGENKIWAKIGGLSVLERTLAAFSTHPAIARVVVVAGEQDLPRVRETAARCHRIAEIDLVAGGDTRAESVRNGLAALPDEIDLVLVHDAARPLVSRSLVDRIIDATLRTGAAVPGLPLSDTVKRTDSAGMVRATVPRTASVEGASLAGLTAVQTPQGARLAELRRAYSLFDFRSSEPTDEASLIEAMGGDVEVVPGDPANIKITRPEDLDLAERLLEPFAASESRSLTADPQALLHAPFPEYRTGFGYDVHAFAAPNAGRKLFLGGIEIDHDRGLEGHSDADVLLHAVCDALLGAVGLGDIGIQFPNTDETYRGISSLRLLEVVAGRVAAAGWQTVNIDCTVVAEAPKLMPHRLRMQETIAACLGIAPERVSVKATTSEKLGFIGRSEGMAAWAVVTVRR